MRIPYAFAMGALLFAFTAPVSVAQKQRTRPRTSRPASPQQQSTAKAPTLDESLGWLKERLTSDAFYKRVSGDDEEKLTTAYKVTSVEFEGCTMTLKTSFALSFSSDPRIRESFTQYKVALGELDPERITVQQLYKDDENLQFIKAFTRNDAARVQKRGDSPGLSSRVIDERAETSIEISFADKDIAERVAKALAHVIKLCGSRAEPF